LAVPPARVGALLRWKRSLLTSALKPGEVQRRFGRYFEIERIAGETDLSGWSRGFAVYLMTRNGGS